MTDEEFKAVHGMTKAELDATIPLGVLRAERNRLLAETDFYGNSDITMSDDMKTYRQALRDLPSTQTPELDAFGGITGVTYPTKPS
tara:strand:+ start:302 stop:559 length:258 start_codon:yes stop_codon:yes gene_type:complete